MQSNAAEYHNKTAFLVIVKQSNGSTYEVAPQMSVKADTGTFFKAIKYPAIGKQWYKINTDKIRNYY